jgi:hypothetical protein
MAEWIRDNLQSGGDADGCRQALISDAHGLGMGQHEFEEEVGDLDTYLAEWLRNPQSADLRGMEEQGTSDG